MENLNELDFTQMLLDEDHADSLFNDSYYLLTPPASVTSPLIDYRSLNTPEPTGAVIKNSITENMCCYSSDDIDDVLLEALDPLLLNIADNKYGLNNSNDLKSRQSPTLSELNFLNSLFCPKEIKKSNKIKTKTVSIGIQCSTSEMMFDRLRLHHPDLIPAPIDTNYYYNFKGLLKNEVPVENVGHAGDTIDSSHGHDQQMTIKVTNFDYYNLIKDDNHHQLNDQETTDGHMIPHTIVINDDYQKSQKESKKKEFLDAFSKRLTNILENRYNKFKIKLYKKRERNLQRNLNLAYNSRLIKSQCKSRYSNKYSDTCQKKKQHPCHECYELFNTRNSLLTHMKLHRKPFCMVCLIFFQSELIKNEHIKSCVSLPLPNNVTTPKNVMKKKSKSLMNNKNKSKLNRTFANNNKLTQPMVVIQKLPDAPLENPHLPIKTEIFSPSANRNLDNSTDAILNITLKPLDDGNKYCMQYKYNFQAISNLTGKTITNEVYSTGIVNKNSYRDSKIIKNKNKTLYKTDDFQIAEPIQRKYITRSGRTVKMYVE